MSVIETTTTAQARVLVIATTPISGRRASMMTMTMMAMTVTMTAGIRGEAAASTTVKEMEKAGETNLRRYLARGGPFPRVWASPDGIPAGGRSAEAMDAMTVTICARNRTEAIYKIAASTTLELDVVRTFDCLKPGMKVEAEINRANEELIKLELED